MPQKVRLKVLIIDDSPMVTVLLTEYLDMLGHQAVGCMTAREGRELLDREFFDLVFLDINLDTDSGLSFLEEYHPRLGNTTFIMISGDHDVENPVQSMRLGAVGYLIKPFDFHAFSRELDRVVQIRSQRMEKEESFHRLQEELETRTRDFLTEVGASFNLQKSLISSLCNLARARDRETGDHLQRIAAYCREIAHGLRADEVYAMEVNDLFISRLTLAAPLHDIGKTGIPDAILLKPGKLTHDEFEIMKKHTVIGRDILSEVLHGFDGDPPEVVRMGMDICAFHHERWDGDGYPHGIDGGKIPLSARVTTVADFYDSLSSSRVYRREPFSHQDICTMIHEGAGTQFDPAVVGAFFRREAQVIKLRSAATTPEDPTSPSLFDAAG